MHHLLDPSQNQIQHVQAIIFWISFRTRSNMSPSSEGHRLLDHHPLTSAVDARPFSFILLYFLYLIYFIYFTNTKLTLFIKNS